MPNPLPGTVIPVGALVSPGGAQGTAGPVGPTGPTGATGTILGPVTFLTAAYNLLPADSFKYFICSGGSWNLQLPAAASGLCYYVRNDMGITGTTGIITILPASGGPAIDGGPSLALLAGQEVAIMTDGTNWRTFGRKREVVIGSVTFVNVPSAFVLLPDGYTEFELTFNQFESASAGPNMQCQVSTDHGNTVQTGNLYYGVYWYDSSATAMTPASYGPVAQWYLTHWIENGFLRHYLKVSFLAGGPNQRPEFMSQSTMYSSGNYAAKFSLGGFHEQYITVNALYLYLSAGNIARMNVIVKGIV